MNVIHLQMLNANNMLLFFCLISSSSLPSLASLQKFCEPNAEIPKFTHCGTCKKRCGTTMIPNHFLHCGHTEQKYLCSCDTFCKFHGDCCHDFEEHCKNENDKFLYISKEYPFNYQPNDFICMNFTTIGDVSIQNLVIHTCSNGSECQFTKDINDVSTFRPMYDIHRGVHYISGQCAMCNGIMDAIPWNIIVQCQSKNSNASFPKSKDTQTTEHIAGMFLPCNKVVLFYVPSGKARPCLHYISTCKSSCKNKKFDRKM